MGVNLAVERVAMANDREVPAVVRKASIKGCQKGVSRVQQWQQA